MKWIPILAIVLLSCSMLSGQDNSNLDTSIKEQLSKLALSINGGYDVLPKYADNYTYYKIDSGLKLGGSLDYYFGALGLGVDYDFFNNTSGSTLSDSIFYEELQIRSSSKFDDVESITRHFLGLGPNFNLRFGNSLGLKIFGRVGYSIIRGGEVISTSLHPADQKTDHHLMFSGFDAGSIAVKGGLKMNYRLNDNLALNLGAYYLNLLSVRPDRSFELNNRGNLGIVYGHTPFVINQDYAIGQGAPFVISAPKDLNELNDPFSSVGITLGLTYLINSKPNTKNVNEVKSVKPMVTNKLKGDSKIIITVEDEFTHKKIPGADVLLKNSKGQIVATGQTNGFGVVEFSKLIQDDYTISGMVYGTKTSISMARSDELNPTIALSKKLIFSDMRFILKGSAVNMRTRAGEPGVAVSLTNNANRSVQQESTSGDGTFGFILDKNSSYSLIGVKENRLSDVKSVSTRGLTRSTTLFVDLELAVENFDCGQGTILNIKYEFDKWEVVPSSRYEIDKVIRYMSSHPNSRIQLSAHTDSRGDADYNLSLSQKRAQAVLDYMRSRGVSLSRVIAQGFGETMLKNQCDDNVNCSETDHAVNRRTEATLICR